MLLCKHRTVWWDACEDYYRGTWSFPSCCEVHAWLQKQYGLRDRALQGTWMYTMTQLSTSRDSQHLLRGGKESRLLLYPLVS